MFIVQVKIISLQCTPSFSKLTTQPKRSVFPLCAIIHITITLLFSLPNALPCLQPTCTISTRGFRLGTFRSRSHGRFSRRPLVAQRQAADLSCTNDCEIPVALTSDRLYLASLKLKAEYNARTGRDCCCVALGELKEKNNKKSRRKRWVHPITCDKRNNGLFWINF